jgi:hypothetical protein
MSELLEAKTAWLDLAQKWLQLALLAEKYAAEQPGQRRTAHNLGKTIGQRRS